MKMICCFCENDYAEGTKVCVVCKDYKGMMTITDFEKVYG